MDKEALKPLLVFCLFFSGDTLAVVLELVFSTTGFRLPSNSVLPNSDNLDRLKMCTSVSDGYAGFLAAAGLKGVEVAVGGIG